MKFMLLLLATLLVSPPTLGAIEISGDHPGGNIIVTGRDGTAIRVQQDLEGVEGWWFYWNMKVGGAAGKTLTFSFVDGNVLGTRGPAYSFDGGKTWSWLGAAHVDGDGGEVAFSFTVPADSDAAILAFAPAYVQRDFERFLESTVGHPNFRLDELCKSEGGRAVERVHLGQLAGVPRHRVFLTARHHACESVASYVLEGTFAAILAETEDGTWFRENVEVLAVPFVDKDGVEEGHQGKNRIPRDHGRDYAGEALYNSTRAIRAFVPDWAGGRLRLALDLHCPHIRGNYNEFIYQVGQEDPARWKEQGRFAAILAAVPDAPLPYAAGNDLPFGQAWNTGGNYTQGMPMARWAGQLPGIHLASTIEIPYANAGDVTITTERARAFGATLVTAMRSYLESLE